MDHGKHKMPKKAAVFTRPDRNPFDPSQKSKKKKKPESPLRVNHK